MPKTDRDVENEVRNAVESGGDIYQQVRTITLKALTERELDLDNIRNVINAAGKGISAGFTSQNEPAKEAIKQSAAALDDALAKAAEASKLAIEELSSQVSDFSREDFDKASEDLKSLEDLLIETLEQIARDSNQLAHDTAQEFITHVRQSGSSVGKQAMTAMEALRKLPHIGKEAVISSTVATTSTLANIASGILSGIAESLNPSRTKDNS